MNNVERVEAHEPEVVVQEPPKEVRIEVIYNWDKERIIEEIRTASKKYGVSYEQMLHTIQCESNFDIDIQSNHTLSYGRELSFGLAQWHIPSGNKTADGRLITKELALDPKEALDAMAYHFSIGNQKLWTCWRMIYLQG